MVTLGQTNCVADEGGDLEIFARHGSTRVNREGKEKSRKD